MTDLTPWRPMYPPGTPLPASSPALPPDDVAAGRLQGLEEARQRVVRLSQEHVREHWSYDDSTGAWEPRGGGGTDEYVDGLDAAAADLARAICAEFGHAWRRWNDITRRCDRCEHQEHGEHLRAALAEAQGTAARPAAMLRPPA